MGGFDGLTRVAELAETSAHYSRPMGPRKIILDCDPGHDDAIALLLAHGNPNIELVAVTTVAGNAPVDKTTRNALAVAQIAGITGVPFAAGASRPLVRPARFAETIHGESGMDGPQLPEPDPRYALDPRHAVQLIIDTVMSHEPGEITLVPTGALTNVALAARLEPRIVPRVHEVVLMGGGVHEGNWSATSEFNMIIDPEAAHIVFHEAWPVTMVGLDVTHQALATDAVRAAIALLDTTPARFVNELLAFFGESYLREQGFTAPPVHDPVAVAYVADPAVLEVRKAPIDIELSGVATLGMTVTDLRPSAAQDVSTQVSLGINRELFWGLVIDALQRIGDPV